MQGDLEGIPSDSQKSVDKENILKPLDVKEDAIKDQLGNSVYFKFYNENEIPQEAREKIEEHVQKYKDGEYINEVSAIYISAGNSSEESRKIIVKDEKDKTVLIKDEKGNLRPNEQNFKGMQVIFDKQGIPTYFAFSKEIERINGLRIMAEKAGKDFLTDLDNQHGLDKYLESLADSIRRERYKMDEYITIFFADLNDLKSANRGGHTEGDQYILMMARLFEESFKRKEMKRLEEVVMSLLQFF
jgi:GGDEF domain-containing protein